MIKKALQSVLNQNFTDFELAIIDNKSTDGTLEYLKFISDRIDIYLFKHMLLTFINKKTINRESIRLIFE